MFDALFGRARRVAWRIVGDSAEAEDVAAEAFARAFARWRKVRRLPYREAWILRVTANLAIDVVRRRQPRLEPRHGSDLGEETALRITLFDALGTLPRRQRQVVLLRYVAGFTQEEVAGTLGISSGSVKTHGHRGLGRLRERLGRDLEEVACAEE